VIDLCLTREQTEKKRKKRKQEKETEGSRNTKKKKSLAKLKDLFVISSTTLMKPERTKGGDNTG